MSLKDLIGMKIRVKGEDESEGRPGIIIDLYLRGDSSQGGRQIERWALLMDKGSVLFVDMDSSTKVIFDNDERLDEVRKKLRNAKTQVVEEISREHLIDLED